MVSVVIFPGIGPYPDNIYTNFSTPLVLEIQQSWEHWLYMQFGCPIHTVTAFFLTIMWKIVKSAIFATLLFPMPGPALAPDRQREAKFYEATNI